MSVNAQMSEWDLKTPSSLISVFASARYSCELNLATCSSEIIIVVPKGILWLGLQPYVVIHEVCEFAKRGSVQGDKAVGP